MPSSTPFLSPESAFWGVASPRTVQGHEAAAVAKDQVVADDILLPARSVARTDAVYFVDTVRAVPGTKLALSPSADTEVAPATGVPFGPATENCRPEGVTGLENVAVTALPDPASGAPSAGEVAVTAGGVTSGVAVVVKPHVRAAAMALPAVSLARTDAV
jgi:hypothetical protein